MSQSSIEEGPRTYRRILIIDDDPSILDLLRAELEQRKFEVVTESSPGDALRILTEQDFGVVISDINMQAMSGVDLCREVATLREDTPVIVITAFASIEMAVSSIRAGAYDFVTKPIDIEQLVLTIERGLRHRELHDEVTRLRQTVGELRPFDDMIGESAAMKRMCDVISRVAQTEATVLVSGESGTGKELVARALHMRSARATGPFVAINCAAMPETLLESELFGHMKGAFTDARTSRSGLFVKATGGTLFLDEVGEMPLGMQAKLLRALQERRVRPVGGETEVPFDARIVAATNRDLEAEVEARHFREDLFYRINVVNVRVPPLRERENDVLPLAQACLQRCQPKGAMRVVGLTSAAAERLTSYPWPGNVRELHNCIERAVALAQFDHIRVEDLPERISQFKPSRITLDGADASTLLPMEEVERRYVRQVLDAMGGNKASAARLLGMDRRTLYRKLERWATEGTSRSPSNGAERPLDDSQDAAI
ncbi:MAG TPA: sigma-54 dependent transcriptional regulator [Polyangiaceae bacterium]